MTDPVTRILQKFEKHEDRIMSEFDKHPEGDTALCIIGITEEAKGLMADGIREAFNLPVQDAILVVPRAIGEKMIEMMQSHVGDSSSFVNHAPGRYCLILVPELDNPEQSFIKLFQVVPTETVH